MPCCPQVNPSPLRALRLATFDIKSNGLSSEPYFIDEFVDLTPLIGLDGSLTLSDSSHKSIG